MGLNAYPDAAFKRNVLIPCNAMTNVKLTLIVYKMEVAAVMNFVLSKLSVKVTRQLEIIVIKIKSVLQGIVIWKLMDKDNHINVKNILRTKSSTIYRLL